jgi:hypothetical protein
MQAATKLSSAPKETKSPTPDRAEETTVRRLLQQTRLRNRRRGPKMIRARMIQI